MFAVFGRYIILDFFKIFQILLRRSKCTLCPQSIDYSVRKFSRCRVLFCILRQFKLSFINLFCGIQFLLRKSEGNDTTIEFLKFLNNIFNILSFSNKCSFDIIERLKIHFTFKITFCQASLILEFFQTLVCHNLYEIPRSILFECLQGCRLRYNILLCMKHDACSRQILIRVNQNFRIFLWCTNL